MIPKDAIGSQTICSLEVLDGIFSFGSIIPVSITNLRIAKAGQIPPLRYHMYLRIQKARSLICNTNLTVSEISELLGFSTVQYCSYAKKSEGVTPSEYRVTALSLQ